MEVEKMTEEDIKKIQSECMGNETRMFSIFLQSDTTEFLLSTLFITAEDYWVEEEPLTMNQFLELYEGEG